MNRYRITTDWTWRAAAIAWTFTCAAAITSTITLAS